MKIKHFFYKLSGSFIIASSLSFTIGSIAFISFKELLKNNENITVTYQKIHLLEKIIGDLKDAETGQRGYLITGKSNFLQPYYSSLNTIDEHINKYVTLLQTDKEKARFRKVLNLKNQKLKDLEFVIELRKSKGEQAAADRVATERGKNIMDDIRVLIEELNADELEKLELRKEQSENLVIVSKLSIIATALLNILILCLAYNLVQEEVKHREIIEKKLIKANRALSFSVRTATEELDNYFQSGYERKLELEKLNSSLKELNLDCHE